MRVINENQMENIAGVIQWLLLNEEERIFRITVCSSIFVELNLVLS
jgi:hypothetical protein